MRMEIYTEVNSNVITIMGMEFVTIPMEMFMMESGNQEKSMEEAFGFVKIKINLKGFGKMGKQMELEQ
jgi:hypothetical protein